MYEYGNFGIMKVPTTLSLCVTIEGFVLYAGGDCALYFNIMLLVQVVAYVMSSTFAIDMVRHAHWT